eukprot:1790907-Prymnesium_polylepis.1
MPPAVIPAALPVALPVVPHLALVTNHTATTGAAHVLPPTCCRPFRPPPRPPRRPPGRSTVAAPCRSLCSLRR